MLLIFIIIQYKKIYLLSHEKHCLKCFNIYCQANMQLPKYIFAQPPHITYTFQDFQDYRGQIMSSEIGYHDKSDHTTMIVNAKSRVFSDKKKFFGYISMLCLSSLLI